MDNFCHMNGTRAKASDYKEIDVLELEQIQDDHSNLIDPHQSAFGKIMGFNEQIGTSLILCAGYKESTSRIFKLSASG